MVDLIGKILRVFADNNLFEEGVELIGSWCFKLYQKHLGVENFPLRTGEFELVLKFPLPYDSQLQELQLTTNSSIDGAAARRHSG